MIDDRLFVVAAVACGFVGVVSIGVTLTHGFDTYTLGGILLIALAAYYWTEWQYRSNSITPTEMKQ